LFKAFQTGGNAGEELKAMSGWKAETRPPARMKKDREQKRTPGMKETARLRKIPASCSSPSPNEIS